MFVLLTLLLMQLAYYVPYSSDYLQSVLLSLCVAYVAGCQSAARTAALAAAKPPPQRRGLAAGGRA